MRNAAYFALLQRQYPNDDGAEVLASGPLGPNGLEWRTGIERARHCAGTLQQQPARKLIARIETMHMVKKGQVMPQKATPCPLLTTSSTRSPSDLIAR